MRARRLTAAIRAFVPGLALILAYAENAHAVGGTGSPETTAAATTPGAPPRVEIVIIGDPAKSGALGARVVSWFHGAAGHASSSALQSLDSTTVFVPTPEVGVRVWVLVRSATSARLVFAVQEHPNDAPRYLVNDVTLDSGLDELGMEHLAQVVYLSAIALWAGNAESSRKDVEESIRETLPAKPKPPPLVSAKRSDQTDRPRASFRLGLELVDRFGDEGLPLRGGLALGVFRARDATVVGGQLHAEIAASTTAYRSDLAVAFSGESLRLGFLLEHRLWQGPQWGSLEIGPGLDVVRYHATSASRSTLLPTAGGRDVRPTLYTSACSRWKFSHLSIQSGVMVIVPLELRRYAIAEPNGSRTVLTPWPVQPEIFSGIYW